MMKRKRILTLLLIAAMTLAMMNFPAGADGLTVSAGTVAAAQNGSAVIPISVSENSDGFCAFGLKITYDKALGSPVVSNGTMGFTLESNTVTGDTNNVTYVAGAAKADVTGNGTLFNLTFSPASAPAGDYTVSVEKGAHNGTGSFEQRNGTELPVTFAAGTVTVAAAGHTHTLTKTEAKAATCTAAGNSAYWYCAGCSKYFSDEGTTECAENSWVIPATNHNYVAYTGDNGEAYSTALTAPQIGTAYCTHCGEAEPSYEMYLVIGKTSDEGSDGYKDVEPARRFPLHSISRAAPMQCFGISKQLWRTLQI